MNRFFCIVGTFLLLVSCNQGAKKENVAQAGTEMAEQVVEQNVEQEEMPDLFFEQFTLEKLRKLLSQIDENAAQALGLSYVYTADDEGDEEDEVGCSVVVYGRDIEKGEEKDFGYELKCTSEHACFYQDQMDTSWQAFLGFKSQDDANRIFDEILKSGIIKMGNSYIITEETVPQGEPVEVESLNDYHPLYEVERPDYSDGFYIIHIYYYC